MTLNTTRTILDVGGVILITVAILAAVALLTSTAWTFTIYAAVIGASLIAISRGLRPAPAPTPPEGTS